jgi:hypothetical protein
MYCNFTPHGRIQWSAGLIDGGLKYGVLPTISGNDVSSLYYDVTSRDLSWGTGSFIDWYVITKDSWGSSFISQFKLSRGLSIVMKPKLFIGNTTLDNGRFKLSSVTISFIQYSLYALFKGWIIYITVTPRSWFHIPLRYKMYISVKSCLLYMGPCIFKGLIPNALTQLTVSKNLPVADISSF